MIALAANGINNTAAGAVAPPQTKLITNSQMEEIVKTSKNTVHIHKLGGL